MCSSAPPDMSAAIRVAEQQNQLGRDTLNWYKQKDAEEQPMREQLNTRALSVADQQLALMETSNGMANEYADLDRTVFRPLKEGIVSDAVNYNTETRRNDAATAAMADTDIAFKKTNEATARALAANGINPGSTRAMSVMQGQGADQAVARAAAARAARQKIETTAHGMKMDAASLGANLASNSATAAQTALAAGNGAVTNAATPLTQSRLSTQMVGEGMKTAIDANSSSGNILTNVAGIQQKANEDNAMWGALGSTAGAYMAYRSDQDLKTGISEVSDEEALEAVNATPVKKWKYDPAKMAKAGIEIPEGAEGENIGPMAQDVNATMGEEAAPGGTKLNPITMNGVNMKAIQAVDKKVMKLTNELSKLSQLIASGRVQAGAQA